MSFLNMLIIESFLIIFSERCQGIPHNFHCFTIVYQIYFGVLIDNWTTLELQINQTGTKGVQGGGGGGVLILPPPQKKF